MANRRSQAEVLDRDFLEIRSKILELAAALDRVDRAGVGETDPRFDQLHRGVETLLTEGTSRAEAVQRLFSLEYEPEWRSRFGLASRAGSLRRP